MSVDLTKAALAEILESARTALGPVTRRKLSRASIEVEIREKGLCVIPNYLGLETIFQLKQEIDRVLTLRQNTTWSDEEGSDRRVFGAEQDSPLIHGFLNDSFIREVGKRYTRSRLAGGLTLAAKVEYRKGNKGSGGGWHRDSPISRQFKSMLYLSDVDPTNGPFEYLVGSHRKSSLLGLISKNLQSFRQNRFSDEEIVAILKKTGITKVQVVGGKGDLVLVDTKGIHRGAPLIQGERYALTNYYFPRRIPNGFSELMMGAHARRI